MSRASRSRLQNGPVEAFNQEAQEALGTSRNLGRTLPVTVHLPKKTLTPGALEPRSPNQKRQGKLPEIDDIDSELCA